MLINNLKICKSVYNNILAISKDAYKFGNVSLAKFDYDLHGNHLDVIAVPKEKKVFLGNSIVNEVKRNKVAGG